jgi:hypothetical protein
MLSCAPVDEQEAETLLRQAYHMVGLEPPIIRWFDSPLQFAQAFSPPLRPDQKTEAELQSEKRRLWPTVNNLLCHEEIANVPIVLWNLCTLHVPRVQSEDNLFVTNVATNLTQLIHDHLTIREFHLTEKIGRNEVIYESVQAYFQVSTLGYYRFFHEVFEENDLIHMGRFNEMVSGYHTGCKEAWIVRKPMRLKLDRQGRFHSDDGKCVEYRDGWGFYAWHGLQVPEKIILHPEQITREEWRRESSIEVRRIMQERMGGKHLIELMGSRSVDQGQRGELLAVDLVNDPEGVAHYVYVKDPSTDQEYYLRVPPFLQRADDAVAWTFGLRDRTYRPLEEA